MKNHQTQVHTMFFSLPEKKKLTDLQNKSLQKIKN